MEKSILVLLVTLLSLALAQENFSASFIIYNDTAISGNMLGTIDYDFNKKYLRNDYQFEGGRETIYEFFNFSTPSLRYLKCGTTCDTETYALPMPIYIRPPTAATLPAITNAAGESCQGWTMTGVVNRAWFNNAGKICRAIFSNGKTIDFLTHMGNADQNKFSASLLVGCPQPTCNKPMDIILVFDESGSILEADFAREVAFGSSLAQGYTFGPNAVAMGLVQFSTGSKVSIPLTNDKSQFINAVNRLIQNGGGTCLGCGLEAAMTEANSIRARTGVTKIFIFLTDGANSLKMEKLAPAADAAHRMAIVFAIGVQSANAGKPLPEQINQIASTIPGVATSFPNIPTFAALSALLNNLISLTCLDIAGTPCGASCRGFCACKGQCICPSSCDDKNFCTGDVCNPNVNGAGCTYFDNSTKCDDKNFCTDDRCDPVAGCIRKEVLCPDPDLCSNGFCNPAVGCQYKGVDCNDRDACTADSCNRTVVGCVNTPIQCDRCRLPTPVICPKIPCFNSECYPYNGTCIDTPYDCDDGNECTIDYCDVSNSTCLHINRDCDDGNACTVDQCNPLLKGGCYSKNFTDDYCDDFNACTLEYCDTKLGCVYSNKTCDDLNQCTVDGCNSAVGCTIAPFNCLSIGRIKKLMGDCYNALCDPIEGCYLQQLPNTIIDRCGICNGDGTSCAYIPLPSNVPIVVGGSLLAVIVIAAIVVAAALGIFGGKKGYDIWLNHRNNMTGAQTSPLYADNGLSGQSPLYAA